VLTVLSFNIHHAEGPDHELNLARVAGEIRASGADVVGLQEVDRHFGPHSGFADQAAELGRMLGMHVGYGTNLDLDPLTVSAPRRQYGTALLSRFPVLEQRNVRLPKADGGEEQRGLLEAVLLVRGHRIRVLNTHLQFDSARARRLQAARIREAVLASAEPVVLTGDLNTLPGDPELAPLTEVLVDAHAVAGSGDGHTFPAPRPTLRIDYVLVGAPLVVCSAQVLPTAASDHRPVRAEILLPSG